VIIRAAPIAVSFLQFIAVNLPDGGHNRQPFLAPGDDKGVLPAIILFPAEVSRVRDSTIVL
jgi:hypothetical protein